MQVPTKIIPQLATGDNGVTGVEVIRIFAINATARKSDERHPIRFWASHRLCSVNPVAMRARESLRSRPNDESGIISTTTLERCASEIRKQLASLEDLRSDALTRNRIIGESLLQASL